MLKIESQLNRVVEGNKDLSHAVKNPLAQHIEQQITEQGPRPFREYMDAMLYGATTPQGAHLPGYYSSPNVTIGDQDGRLSWEQADFYTSPEYSPLFGMLLGSQVIEMYDKLDKPDDFTIVEMGAGNGTLAHDILHGIKYFSEQGNRDVPKLRYVIVEKSETLSRKQKERLKKIEGFSVDVVQGSALEVPLSGVTGVVISNELPDAFPVDLIRKRNGLLEQLYVGKGDTRSFTEVWGQPDENVRAFHETFPKDIPEDGRSYPCNTAMVTWMEDIARMLRRGFVVTIDYDQIYQKESKKNGERFPMRIYASEINEDGRGRNFFDKDMVGRMDITTGVDFHTLAAAGKMANLKTEGYTTQSGFLFSLGYHGWKTMIPRSFPYSIGDRKHRHIPHLDEYMLDPGFKVLIQSQGVAPNTHLTGLDYTLTSENERKFFTSLPGQEVTVWEE